MNRERERGVVLVGVLLAVAIMSVMVVALTALTRSEIANLRLEERLLASRLALRSAIEAGKAIIAVTTPEQRIFFDATPRKLLLGDGLSAELTIRDAAGAVDLNRSDLRVLSALLSQKLKPEIEKELLVRFQALRQTAGEAELSARPVPKSPEATQQTAQAQSQAQSQAGQPLGNKALPILFHSTEQLLALLPVADEASNVSASLGANVTVFNPTGMVNPFAASRAVLASLPGMTAREIAAIDGARKNRDWMSDGIIIQMVNRLKPFVAVENPSVFVIGVRLIDGPNVIPQSRAEAVVQETKDGALPFRTLSVSGL